MKIDNSSLFLPNLITTYSMSIINKLINIYGNKFNIKRERNVSVNKKSHKKSKAGDLEKNTTPVYVITVIYLYLIFTANWEL